MAEIGDTQGYGKDTGLHLGSQPGTGPRERTAISEQCPHYEPADCPHVHRPVDSQIRRYMRSPIRRPSGSPLSRSIRQFVDRFIHPHSPPTTGLDFPLPIHPLVPYSRSIPPHLRPRPTHWEISTPPASHRILPIFHREAIDMFRSGVHPITRFGANTNTPVCTSVRGRTRLPTHRFADPDLSTSPAHSLIRRSLFSHRSPPIRPHFLSPLPVAGHLSASPPSLTHSMGDPTSPPNSLPQVSQFFESSKPHVLKSSEPRNVRISGDRDVESRITQ